MQLQIKRNSSDTDGDEDKGENLCDIYLEEAFLACAVVKLFSPDLSGPVSLFR